MIAARVGPLLCAEDDPDDRLLVQEAFQGVRLVSDLRFVADGEELIDYLLHQGTYRDPRTSPRPLLVLLDLNMPRMNGREALARIRTEPSLRSLPVIVLTTSSARDDVEAVYAIGGNSYIVKPVTFDGLVRVAEELGRYWLQLVELPEIRLGERRSLMLGRIRRRDATATATATELPPGAPRILLIDDDPDEAELVRDSLERAGAFYRVENASSAETGLERLAEGGFEAALVDYRLGEWSGLDVLRKAQQKGWRTPMILLTGERDPDVDQAATSLGAVDFLRKGKTSPEELERAIRFAAANGRALSAARSAEARTAALEEMGRLLGEHGDAPEVLDRVVGLISESFERPFVALYLNNGESFSLASERGHLASNQIIDRAGPIGNALRMHRTAFVPNASSHPDQRGRDPQMELCLPVAQDSETFGLLLIGQDENRAIAESEHAALVSAASRIGAALAMAQDRQEVAARAVRARRTHTFVARLAATPNAGELARTLAEACAATLEVTRAVVVRVQGESGTVISSFGPDAAQPGSAAVLNDLDHMALTEKRPASATRETRTAAGGLERAWEASLPVARGGTVIALLHVARAGAAFDVYEREAATFVAGLLALILPG